jgi:hypothetical protein
MRGVQAAAARGHRGQRFDLGLWRLVAGPVFEPGREAERAVVEGLLGQRAHARQAAISRARECAVADEGRDVDGRLCGLQPIEVVAEAAPVQGHAGVEVADQVARIGAGRHRRGAEAALADDLGGHALADLAVGAAIDEQREVAVGVDVDEAGRDGVAARVDHARRGRAAQVAQRHHALAAHAHIGVKGRRAAAVDDAAAADQDVEHGREISVTPWPSPPVHAR